MDKTREELLREVDNLRCEKEAALSQAAKAERLAKQATEKLAELDAAKELSDECYTTAKQLNILKVAFMKAGFTSEESFELLLHMLPSTQQTSAVSLFNSLLS